jgi:LytR cell envelope-related transcriptional attenuator
MKTTEELLNEIDELLEEIGDEQEPAASASPPPESGPVEVAEPTQSAEQIEPPEPGEPIEPGQIEPSHTKRRRALRRRQLGRGIRFIGIMALGFAVGAAGAAGVLLFRRDERSAERSRTGAPVGEQSVLAWTVWNQAPPGAAFVAILGSGGGREPVAVGVPTYTVVSIPGHGLGTVADAARTGDADLVSTTVQNLVQVPFDAAVASTSSDLRALVDRAGGIDVGSEHFTGQQALAYLFKGREESAELRFLRWQEIVGGVLAAVETRPDALEGIIPNEAVPMFAAAASSETEVVALPVQDVGAGLARPVAESVEALVAERFVIAGQAGGTVRLVVLNGNGIPGIGEAVTRALVPAGFRLVSSQNAPAFDVKTTTIIASTEEFLDEARLARELLGVGDVYLGEQPTGVADVSVVIGRDFGGA